MHDTCDSAPFAKTLPGPISRWFRVTLAAVVVALLWCAVAPVPAGATVRASSAAHAGGAARTAAAARTDGAARTAAAAQARSGVQGRPGARWSWPVPAPHDVVTGFEAPAETWSPGHRGIDIEAAPATVVLAPESGTVHFAGVVVDRPVLSLAHAGGVLSSFEPVVASVVKGEPVERGQPIGVLQEGHCAKACLHLGARIDGDYVSPLLLLGEIRPAVLLPIGAG